MMRLGRITVGVTLALLAPALRVAVADTGPGEPSVRTRYLMGTRCEIKAFGPESTVGPALDAALDRIAEIEDALTTWRADGELARLNAALHSAPAEPVRLSPDLDLALRQALELARHLDGRFDPTIGALVETWDLHGAGRLPTDDELRRALDRTSWSYVEVDPARSAARYTRPGVVVELGGFGKGFALDAAARLLRRRGIDAALINFGGQVLALGSPPGASAWIVEVADPADRFRPALSLALRDASVSTSGNAERSRTVAGRPVGHLLDPRTGRPSTWSGSVTVVAPGAAVADALSTALAVDAPRIDAATYGDLAYLLLDGRFAVASPALRALLMESDGIEFVGAVPAPSMPVSPTPRTPRREESVR